MDRHAGFAAALTIRGETIQDLLSIAYHAGSVPHRLAGTASGVAADLFLDLPRLEFRRADGDQVRLVLRGWGPLTITPPNHPAETRQVVLEATVLAEPRVGLVGSDDPEVAPKLTLALGGILPPLLAMSIRPVAGGPFSADAQALIDSASFRTGVQFLIGQQLAGMQPSGLDAGFLGGIAGADGTTITAVVRDGVLGIGIDVFDAVGDGLPVTTEGDRNALVDFTEGDDIAISINRVAVSLAFDSVRAGIEEKVADAGADLNTYTFAVQQGRFFIAGSASSSEGSVSFSMHAVPQLTRPGFSREYDELWFDMRDIDVDVNLSWWAAALGSLFTIITLGFGYVVVKGLMSEKRSSTTADISRTSLRRQAARVQEFTLPGTTGPLVRLTLQRFECLAEEVFITSTLQPQIPAPKVTGHFVVPVEEAVSARSLDFPVLLPFDTQPDDPQLNIRWTVRRSDTNEEVFVTDGQAQPRLILRISNDFIPFVATPEFGIECRVYRTLGADVEELFADTRTLRIFDPIDRSHPYVHWSHEVWAPQVQVDNGSRVLLGYTATGRRSKLHRTDIPGRCRSVSHFSLNQIRDAGPGVTPSVIQYLDALPFPVADLVAQRKQVCDYCFFGGPTRTVPLVT